MRNVGFAGLILVLGAGCSSTSSSKPGNDAGYNTGGTGNVATGGSGNSGAIGGSGGTGNVGTGGTGNVATGGTGNVGTGGATGGSGNTDSGPPPSLDPTCTGLTTTSGGSCYPATPCNPMTNAGCTTAGAACDIADTGFQCYDPPNDIAVCGACGEGAYCQAGNVCINSQCLHYCCTDADCGTGKCYDIPLSGSTAAVKACLNTAPPSG